MRRPLRLAAVLAGAGMLGAPAAWAAAETVKLEAPFRYNSKGRRDPFAPLVRDGQLVSVAQSAPVQTSHPMLHGILWDPDGQSIALINDMEAKVGDTIGDYQVTEIRYDAVVLSNGGEPLVLEITFGAPLPSSPSSATTGGERQ
ncbi:MAG: hypothetical protein HY599_02215 [Candidatus Omnitrophica bacterium]|nr:hypothetical protein [Candidatus Omnitrophota bacterium]